MTMELEQVKADSELRLEAARHSLAESDKKHQQELEAIESALRSAMRKKDDTIERLTEQLTAAEANSARTERMLLDINEGLGHASAQR